MFYSINFNHKHKHNKITRQILKINKSNKLYAYMFNHLCYNLKKKTDKYNLI